MLIEHSTSNGRFLIGKVELASNFAAVSLTAALALVICVCVWKNSFAYLLFFFLILIFFLMFSHNWTELSATN